MEARPEQPQAAVKEMTARWVLAPVRALAAAAVVLVQPERPAALPLPVLAGMVPLPRFPARQSLTQAVAVVARSMPAPKAQVVRAAVVRVGKTPQRQSMERREPRIWAAAVVAAVQPRTFPAVAVLA